MERQDYLCGGYVLSVKRGEELPHAKLTAEKVIAIRINRHGKTRNLEQAKIDQGGLFADESA